MLFQDDPYQLAAGSNPGFLEKLLEGGFYRTLRDIEAHADFLVTQPLKDTP